MLRYLVKNQGTTSYLVVTTDSNTAAPYIIQTGKPVMSLGGFGGNDPILTVTQFQALVKNNTVRYVLAGGRGGGGGDGNTIMQWVQTACAAVPSSAWQGATSSTTGGAGATSANNGSFGGGGADFGGSDQLYDCAGA